MARDEDIFRKLNKQTPIVKQKGLQTLSPKDFTLSRNTVNVPVVSPDKKRNGKKEIRRDEPVIFSRENDRADESRPAVKREASSLAFGREQQEVKRVQVRRDTQSYNESPRILNKEAETYDRPRTERKAEIITQRPKPVKKEEPKLDVFADKVRPQREYEPRTAARENAVQDVSIMEAAMKKEDMLSLRHELKYYINYRDYVLLRSTLKALISPDPNADANNSYHVRSLYFDDIYDTALVEKMAGSDSRKKYRVRIYNFSDDNIKFEKKFKIGQYVGKKTISLSRGEYDSIIAGEYDFLKDRDEELAKEIYLEMRSSLLRPKVIVDYMREAYVSPFEDCRITFDKDLRAGLMLHDIFDPDAPVMPMFESGLMVLEVKFNRYLPEYIKRVLNNINAADRCAISKYVICRKYD